MFRPNAFVLAVALCAGAWSATAGAAAIGPEVVAIDRDGLGDPVIATDADGGFFVAWQEPYREVHEFPENFNGVVHGNLRFARRFDGDGQPVAAAWQLDQIPQGGPDQGVRDDRTRLSLAATAAGGFAIGWYHDHAIEYFGSGFDEHFLVQRHDGTTGAPVADAIEADGISAGPNTPHFVYPVHFVIDSADGLATAGLHRSVRGGLSDTYFSVLSKRIDAAGTQTAMPTGYTPFEEADDFDLGQATPRVAMTPSGDSAVLVWVQRERGAADAEAVIYARRFDAAGVPLGERFAVSRAADSRTPSVAMGADGRFVIAWSATDAANPANGSDIFVRRFRGDGTPTGPRVRVNQRAAGAQVAPAVAMDADGSFVVAWQSDAAGDRPRGRDVLAQAFRPNDAPRRGNFLLSERPAGDQAAPAISLGADGEGWAMWSVSASEVRARRLSVR